MKIIDLFAGIGGFSLAAHWMGWETAAFVEWDTFGQKVLAKNFPNVPIYGDIREFDGKPYRGAVDLVCGGFPCQPFSSAGQRKGTADDRYLWPEMLRVIREVQPAWVVGENVAGIISMDGGSVLEEILSSLEGEGYIVQVFLIPALAVGAPHRRDRVWIVANADTERLQSPGAQDGEEMETSKGRRLSNTTKGFRCTDSTWAEHWLQVATRTCRMDDGIPRRVDRAKRLKALGNAIVPQVAFEIFKSISCL